MRRLTLLLALPLLSCARHQPERSQMWAHYQRVGAIQSAVIAGDLNIAQAAAYWVAHNQPADLPELAAPYADAMRSAARATAGASDLDEAALATARMGDACGSCHQVLRQGPRFTVTSTAPPPSDTSVAQQMTLHLWALSKMWDGLTGPSAESWMQGALGLNAVPHYQAHITRRFADDRLADSLAHRLYALGQQSAMANPTDRVVVYGELIGTCAACHRALGVRLPRVSADGRAETR